MILIPGLRKKLQEGSEGGRLQDTPERPGVFLGWAGEGHVLSDDVAVERDQFW